MEAGFLYSISLYVFWVPSDMYPGIAETALTVNHFSTTFVERNCPG